MANKTTGEIISSKRHEKGMTQKDLAELLNITDKAVSKWERDVALPDINTIPKLAEILDISIEELIKANPQKNTKNRKTDYLIDLILKAVPLALGVCVVVTSILDELPVNSGFIMLGSGIFCIGLYLLRK
ncbi:MAG: helix-turn-helix transcriptional regulator [Ruminococcaceae bacterium]|nr:helix-turn-helix transcriptional regulator [Oscillospiraceae bacterium]